MSKQRVAHVRRKDWSVLRAFEIALAQQGVSFNDDFGFVEITGNKSAGKVTIRVPENEGEVIIEGKGDIFFQVLRVLITTLDGQKQPEPIVVEFANFDGEGAGLHFILSSLTEHRNHEIHRVAGLAWGYEIADSLLHFLWKYPYVEIDGDDIKLSYVVHELGIERIELWYNRMVGYTKARIVSEGETYTFTRTWYSSTWLDETCEE